MGYCVTLCDIQGKNISQLGITYMTEQLKWSMAGVQVSTVPMMVI